MPTFDFENCYPGVVAGIDEAGRGPLCGPVYAACVVLDRINYPKNIDDSKKISEKNREKIFEEILEFEQKGILFYGAGLVEPGEIDKINILNATKVAMAMAYGNLLEKYGIRVDMVLVDGNFVPNINTGAMALVGGDGLSYSIACASLVAKVLRDRELRSMDSRYPQYGWIRNKGYGTAEHLEALERYGLVENYHRKSFCRRFGPFSVV
ncbi:MAG: ribonuclease HII [Rickettsiales bacterium]|jgi:ribonuclease HII|nr:ribonuclease HII [Rickettsiales bacterium]